VNKQQIEDMFHCVAKNESAVN